MKSIAACQMGVRPLAVPLAVASDAADEIQNRRTQDDDARDRDDRDEGDDQAVFDHSLTRSRLREEAFQDGACSVQGFWLLFEMGLCPIPAKVGLRPA
jgi:hypothetical protein